MAAHTSVCLFSFPVLLPEYSVLHFTLSYWHSKVSKPYTHFLFLMTYNIQDDSLPSFAWGFLVAIHEGMGFSYLALSFLSHVCQISIFLSIWFSLHLLLFFALIKLNTCDISSLWYNFMNYLKIRAIGKSRNQ